MSRAYTRVTLAFFAACVMLVGTASGQDRGIAGTTPGPATPAPTEKRVALVIGNAAYDASPLRNAVNDARDMTVALRGCGFEVTVITDCDLAAIEEAVGAFGDAIPGVGVALFYYAGHGCQVEGEN